MSLYAMNTNLLATLNPHILKVLDAFHSFNHQVNVKRKDTVSAISTVKEVEVGGSFGAGGKHDPDEFEKFSTSSKYAIIKEELKNFEIEETKITC